MWRRVYAFLVGGDVDGLDGGGHGPRVGGVRSLVLVYAAIIAVCLLMLSLSKKKLMDD